MPLCGSTDDVHRASESSPLLTNKLSNRHDLSSSKGSKPSPMSLKLQVILLCYARLMEPLAFFSIFPYIAEMVQRNGKLHHSDIGFYSGLVEALFSATQAITLFFWGTLADRFGRKPMLVASLVGMTVGTGVFSMSRTIWQMMLLRGLTGLFSGANLIIRTMVGENCTLEIQARLFSWYAAAGNLGIFMGPIIGGALSNPTVQYPSVFGDIDFLKEHPYALSGFVTAAMNATAVLISVFGLRETLPERTDKGMPKNVARRRPGHQISLRQLLRTPKVMAVLGVYSYVMSLAIFFTAIHPVVLYTRISYGGFGLSPAQITIFITAIGASETLWLMIAFPLLQHRTGTRFVLKLCSLLWPMFFAGYLATTALLRLDDRALATVVTISNMIIGPGAFMSLTAVQMGVNEVSPSPGALAKLNSVAELSFSIIRSVIPGIATAIFAAGARGNGAYLAWVLLIVLTLGLPLSLRLFPNSLYPLAPAPSDQCGTCNCRSQGGHVCTLRAGAQA